MLRLSDGKWTTKTIIRAEPVEGNASELVGQVITGIESGGSYWYCNIFH